MRSALYAILFSASCAYAQGATYDGTWTAEYKTLMGAPAGATATLTGTTGTWYAFPLGTPNICIGRDFPIAVIKASNEELVFEVDRSAVRGCTKSLFNLRAEGEGLKGEFDGRAVSLRRK